MIRNRLIVLVEGPTEEAFVNEILSVHLYRNGYLGVSARLLGNARQRGRRGGIKAWSSTRKDILTHLKQDQGVVTTTLVDYYGLLQSEQRGWPGRQEANRQPFHLKAHTVESALMEDLAEDLGHLGDPVRFKPFVVMHEFEGLLFSDCNGFAQGLMKPELATAFQEIRDKFRSPEEINDSITTAPSKRVAALVDGYKKPYHGRLAMQAIGLEKVRAECLHFNQWLTFLEQWPSLHD